jgi:Zn ribbon nucleic-acid-binding protein
MSKVKKTKIPHWYFIFRTECVLCGHLDEVRERRITHKPKKYAKRIKHIQDACSSHFL